MIYNNLIYFLVVIFLLSADMVPDAPRFGAALTCFCLLFLYALFSWICARTYAAMGKGAPAYFAAEKKLSLVSLAFFVVLLHFLDLKYYLHPLSFDDRLPVLENIGLLFFYYLLLVIMWLRGRKQYAAIFGRSHSALSLAAANTRANLPIILPWLALSLVFDLLFWWNIPLIRRVLDSAYGDFALFAFFVLFLALIFPPLVRRLWNCTPLPPSPLRREIEDFCRRQNFSSEILVWPLFEGQAITAGIMGIVPGLRYLLITPALLNTMDRDELEAVLAHEIGHVKKKHLLLYLLLFLGFSVFAGAAAAPLPFLYLGSDWFYELSAVLNISPEDLIAVLSAAPVLLLMVLYFRYLFGFFIRNFERQADLHVFKALGHSHALVSSFEKIARLGGNIREQKSWHHFGIGERIDFLEQCERDRSLLRRHDLKVYASLAAYIAVIALLSVLLGRVDTDKLAAGSGLRFWEAVILHKLAQEPENGLLLMNLGDLMMEKKMERQALDAYERALRVNPGHADINNNLSWLLSTARDKTLRDPKRALRLAEHAVSIREEGYILDTLAVALWADGQVERAINVEQRAIEVDPAKSEYYREMIRKMASESWRGANW